MNKPLEDSNDDGRWSDICYALLTGNTIKISYDQSAAGPKITKGLKLEPDQLGRVLTLSFGGHEAHTIVNMIGRLRADVAMYKQGRDRLYEQLEQIRNIANSKGN